MVKYTDGILRLQLYKADNFHITIPVTRFYKQFIE